MNKENEKFFLEDYSDKFDFKHKAIRANIASPAPILSTTVLA